jgi:hypothetical protein
MRRFVIDYPVSALAQKKTEMFTYNLILCLTANTTGLISKFWKLYSGMGSLAEELFVCDKSRRLKITKLSLRHSSTII